MVAVFFSHLYLVLGLQHHYSQQVYVNIMNKLCGRNIVPVLATLFLLSYTKLQRTISASLSFTAVDVSNGHKYFVWLEDGNVRYLQGKHIPLFLVSMLFLIGLFIPYTLSVMLGPWLQTKTQYRVFCWVLKLKPFFDACFGPLKDKHRYWTGVLLVSRIILSLVSTGNVLGDDSVNLIAIITLVIILLALLGQAGGVYKTWILSLLDCFFWPTSESWLRSHCTTRSQVAVSMSLCVFPLDLLLLYSA